MPPTPHRGPLLAAATLGLLTSCTPMTPLAAHDAVAHYEALAADSHGAVLTVTDQGEIRITDVQVDAEECTPEALGLG